MKHYLLYISLISALFYGCGSPAKKPKVETGSVPSYRFRMVQPPTQATDEDKFAYMAEHYWDKFDFADTVFISKVDTFEMLRAYAAYVANFVGPTNQEPIKELMARASTSKPMFEYFVMLAEKVLHDPNSPVRSEELYIPVLEAQLATPFYDEYERIAPAYDLEIANQNRIGRKANDFKYTLASGRTSNLYSIDAEYVLIFINNPGCPMCKSIQAAVVESPMLNELQERGSLVVLALYPDEDLDAWRSYAPSMPAKWINSYDKGCAVREKNLYDLRAIPAMYLLDSQKRVLVKDSTSVEEIEFVIDRQ